VRDAGIRDDVVRGSAFTVIDTSNQDLAKVTPIAWKALQRANDPPILFRYGGAASRIETGDVDLLGDFPLVGESERTNAIALRHW
jgi:hypothetical protein